MRPRLWQHPFLYDPEPAVPTPPAPEAPPEPAAAAVPDGPWAKDLAEAFDDPAVRAQVDTFMRDRYQPYVTGLEDQARVYKDLTENPHETMVALTNELYGETVAERMIELINKGVEPEVAAQTAAAEAAPPAATPTELTLDQMPPEVRAQVEREQEAREQTEYLALLDAYRAENGVTFTTEEIGPYVAFHGNIDQAYKHLADFKASVAPSAEPTPVPTHAPAPPALGSSATPGGTPTPPTTPKYASIDDALQSFVDEDRAARQAPATV